MWGGGDKTSKSVGRGACITSIVSYILLYRITRFHPYLPGYTQLVSRAGHGESVRKGLDNSSVVDLLEGDNDVARGRAHVQEGPGHVLEFRFGPAEVLATGGKLFDIPRAETKDVLVEGGGAQAAAGLVFPTAPALLAGDEGAEERAKADGGADGLGGLALGLLARLPLLLRRGLGGGTGRRDERRGLTHVLGVNVANKVRDRFKCAAFLAVVASPGAGFLPGGTGGTAGLIKMGAYVVLGRYMGL